MATFYVLSTGGEALFRWVAAAGGDIQLPGGESRLPTVAEIKRVLGTITTHELEFLPNADRRGIDIKVTSRRGPEHGTSTLLLITHKSDGNTIEDLTFHESNSELAVEIIRQLTFLCGPLVLVESDSASPWVVTTETDTATAVEQWLRS